MSTTTTRDTTPPSAPDTEVGERPGRRRFSARDAVRCVLIACVVLVVCDGDGMRGAAEDMRAGPARDVVSALAGPAGWLADRLPFADAADEVTGWLRSGDDLANGNGTFTAARGAGGSGRVSPAAFAPATLGERAPLLPLRTVLVTGDSMSQPMDAELARRLAGDHVKTTRDVHLGSGISKSFVVDWGKLSAQQAARDHADLVVVFLGANEGFPMRSGHRQLQCCGADWAAEYATRARAMMDVYRRGGAARVLWLLIPAPRDPARARIVRTVNAAVRVAAGPFGAQVGIVDTPALFTPGGRFRAAMSVAGRQQVVRNPDGIHLNELGASVLADSLMARLGQTYDLER